MKLELLLGRQVEFVCNNMVIEAVRARVKEAAIASATLSNFFRRDISSKNEASDSKVTVNSQ